MRRRFVFHPIRRRWVAASGRDSVLRPDERRTLASIVNLGHVLNVNRSRDIELRGTKHPYVV
jgi:hypothetical protein